MRLLLWTTLAMLLIVPDALATRGDLDLRVDADADLAVRAHARGHSRWSYEWDWGDGETAVGASARHAYRSPGVYSVVVRATDEDGRTIERAREVEVRAAAPRAARVDVDVRDGRAVAVADVDAGTRVSWDWGDGHHGSGRRATHRYDEPGEYEVVATCERRGETWTERHVVRVELEEDARASLPAVSARVSLGGDDEPARDDVRERGHARAGSSVRVQTSERHDAPGAPVPLALGALGAVALAARALRRPGR